ncbi:13543_t:CDS:1, partial [Dentiscutata heterogama]
MSFASLALVPDEFLLTLTPAEDMDISVPTLTNSPSLDTNMISTPLPEISNTQALNSSEAIDTYEHSY